MTELSTSFRYFCTSGRCSAAWVRSDEVPVAATRVPMVAASPEVETLGFVLPRVNLPHSGCPLEAQPRALATGSGMASTSGVEVTTEELAGTLFGRSLAVSSLRSRLTQVDAAG